MKTSKKKIQSQRPKETFGLFSVSACRSYFNLFPLTVLLILFAFAVAEKKTKKSCDVKLVGGRPAGVRMAYLETLKLGQRSTDKCVSVHALVSGFPDMSKKS